MNCERKLYFSSYARSTLNNVNVKMLARFVLLVSNSHSLLPGYAKNMRSGILFAVRCFTRQALPLLLYCIVDMFTELCIQFKKFTACQADEKGKGGNCHHWRYLHQLLALENVVFFVRFSLVLLCKCFPRTPIIFHAKIHGRNGFWIHRKKTRRIPDWADRAKLSI